MESSMASPSVRLAIVDPTPQDYVDLLSAGGTPGVSMHFLVSGNDAIRFARRWQTALWVVNTRLLDMGGFDLAEMLRSIRPSALIFMIGDQYSLDEELQTLTLGLAKYLCKPLEPSWVLPQYEESCIPMSALRGWEPSFRVISLSEQARGDHVDDDHIAGAICDEPGGADQVILPFERNDKRRPAA